MDRHGRVFYIDHKNRTTSWQKPETVPCAPDHGDSPPRDADDQTGDPGLPDFYFCFVYFCLKDQFINLGE
jgi:hypothetical protein